MDKRIFNGLYIKKENSFVRKITVSMAIAAILVSGFAFLSPGAAMRQ